MAKFNQKKELGKGIRALLGDINSELKEDVNFHAPQVAISKIEMVELSRIEVNPFQPRIHFDKEALEDLADSIRIHGIIQPLTVRQIPGKEKLQLISGERRWRASHMAELIDVPVYIRTANDQEALEMALIENVQREELNAIEVGVNYQRLLDECELSHEDLATRIGKKRATITNYTRLLKLPPDIQVGVRENKISMGHARALAGIEEIDIQLSLFNDTIRQDLSVRRLEALVAIRSSNKKPKEAAHKESMNPYLKKWQESLIHKFSSKIDIRTNVNGSGSIQIPFSNKAEMERIYELLIK
jgi:ParB family transcriptional regulator, chromosome partitioning protein